MMARTSDIVIGRMAVLRGIALVAVVALLSLLVGCGGQSAAEGEGSGDVLRIAYLRSPSPVTLAKVHGSIEEELEGSGTSVEWVGPFPSFAPAVEAMNGGSADLTVGSITATTGALSGEGTDLTVFARQESNPSGEGLLVKKDGEIENVGDLVGKTVAVNRGGTGEYLLNKALIQNDIDLDEVERAYLLPPDAATAFEGGDVDAWAAWDPYVALGEAEYDAEMLASGGELGSDNDIVFVARTEYLDQNRPVVRAVYDVLRNESQLARSNREETITAYQQELRLPESAIDPLVDRPYGVVEPVSEEVAAKYRSVAGFLYEEDILPSEVDIEDHLMDIRDFPGDSND